MSLTRSRLYMTKWHTSAAVADDPYLHRLWWGRRNLCGAHAELSRRWNQKKIRKIQVFKFQITLSKGLSCRVKVVKQLVINMLPHARTFGLKVWIYHIKTYNQWSLIET